MTPTSYRVTTGGSYGSGLLTHQRHVSTLSQAVPLYEQFRHNNGRLWGVFPDGSAVRLAGGVFSPGYEYLTPEGESRSDDLFPEHHAAAARSHPTTEYLRKLVTIAGGVRKFLHVADDDIHPDHVSQIHSLINSALDSHDLTPLHVAADYLEDTPSENEFTQGMLREQSKELRDDLNRLEASRDSNYDAEIDRAIRPPTEHD